MGGGSCLDIVSGLQIASLEGTTNWNPKSMPTSNFTGYPSNYELWSCKQCQTNNGFTYCQWPNQFNPDGGCLPNIGDGQNVPCGETDGGVIVKTCQDGDVCSNNECDQCFIQDFGCVMYGKMGLPNTKECLKWGGTDCSGGLGCGPCVDICGHPCQVAIAPWGMNLECSTKWEDGCKGIDPPEGFTSQSTLYQLCPNECLEPVEPECSNLKSDVLCNKWSSDGYCTGKWAIWMKKNCKKTCNKC